MCQFYNIYNKVTITTKRVSVDNIKAVHLILAHCIQDELTEHNNLFFCIKICKVILLPMILLVGIFPSYSPSIKELWTFLVVSSMLSLGENQYKKLPPVYDLLTGLRQNSQT
jgi:hypothetical protein